MKYFIHFTTFLPFSPKCPDILLKTSYTLQVTVFGQNISRLVSGFHYWVGMGLIWSVWCFFFSISYFCGRKVMLMMSQHKESHCSYIVQNTSCL